MIFPRFSFPSPSTGQLQCCCQFLLFSCVRASVIPCAAPLLFQSSAVQFSLSSNIFASLMRMPETCTHSASWCICIRIGYLLVLATHSHSSSPESSLSNGEHLRCDVSLTSPGTHTHTHTGGEGGPGGGGSPSSYGARPFKYITRGGGGGALNKGRVSYCDRGPLTHNTSSSMFASRNTRAHRHGGRHRALHTAKFSNHPAIHPSEICHW